jgi:uncharacterized membrane protein
VEAYLPSLHQNMKGLNTKFLLLIIVFFGIIIVNMYNLNEECPKSKRRSTEKKAERLIVEKEAERLILDCTEKLKTTRTTNSAATTTTAEGKIKPNCQALINVRKNKIV